MRMILPILLMAALQGAGCNEAATTNTATTTPPATAAAIAPQAEMPNDPRMGDSLIAVMGPLEGRVVADMFAGDGYYTWKLLAAGARVLAIEEDPEAIAKLQAWKAGQGIGDDRLLIRQTTPGVPGLLPGEADLALITREYSTLENRQAWISELMAGIKMPHTFFLVNYMPQQTPDGPPLSQRMDYDSVSDELTAFGVDDIGILYKTLPGRYILFGSRPPVSTDTGGE